MNISIFGEREIYDWGEILVLLGVASPPRGDNATTEYTKDKQRQELVAKIDFSSLGTNEERIARRHVHQSETSLSRNAISAKKDFLMPLIASFELNKHQQHIITSQV